MTTLAVIVIMWIVAVGILLGRKVNEPPEESETPPGVYILDNPEWGYNYVFETHRRGGIGYRTRGAAIRAAWVEYHRILKKGTGDVHR